MLFVVFLAVSTVTRLLVLRCCNETAREELSDQANNLLTGVSATFAFFVGFAISISWGAVTASQSAVEQQAAAINQMAWELRSVPDPGASAALMNNLTTYATTAAERDTHPLAHGNTTHLPSAGPLEEFQDALSAYVYGPGSGVKGAPALLTTASELMSSSAGVSAVASRALPRPMAALLFIVAVLVTIILGITTVRSGRSSMVFVYMWCLIPALSLAVVLALAFPFALRSGMTTAPLRAVAESLSTR
jgi:hypothetical protein